jgi:hypothetical protein
LVLSQPYCDLGFGNLQPPEQNLLRGALVQTVNAACPDCPMGIDISQANYSVNVFAEGLLANCEQVGRIVRNFTGQDPGQLSSYEDLWRFTLINYNAGSGCLADAINLTLASGEPLDWAHVITKLEPACQASIGYVEDVSGMRQVGPTPTPWLSSAGSVPTVNYPRVQMTPTALPTGLVRTATPIPSPTITPVVSATPTSTITVDPTYLPTATLNP